MAMTVHCDIVSAEGKIFSGLVEFLVASGSMGELGILPNHAPLLTTLEPGYIKITRQGGKEEMMYVSGGFLEVQPNLLTILADTVTRADDIDQAAAEKAAEEAKKEMEHLVGDPDYAYAAARLAEAMAQLRVLEAMRRRRK
ncbi:F0F1 ATP synthase subunit epsilon [Salinispirillum marinum]|uniref:ATP synthase epsilon chain n=2 Tax=Saccharospirillaceae TaxID=255527 RepID=A0ABV8BBS7_9GAMM